MSPCAQCYLWSSRFALQPGPTDDTSGSSIIIIIITFQFIKNKILYPWGSGVNVSFQKKKKNKDKSHVSVVIEEKDQKQNLL